eukprot:gnl/Ergobibamus_cyprinoides/129.p1 GENE.gnl/Ergobibamus_cyprinoides/129~~gnl/Ergobibamus_cyprinoides/129.p1  ORF type:complete len:402 (+),score=142.07 gnl/Ergobibamus_cyprinoides/129:142-1206(+)
MFLFMSFMLFKVRQERRADAAKASESATLSESDPLVPPAAPASSTEHKIPSDILLAVPALLDVLGSYLTTSALLSYKLPPSVYQLMSGAVLIFTALGRHIFLRRPLFVFEWSSAGITLIGLAFTAWSAGLASDADDTSIPKADLFMGIFVNLLAQVCYAALFVVEELLFATRQVSAATVVGMEGLWGFVTMAVIVLPVSQLISGPDNGHYEDTVDSFLLLAHNPWLVFDMFCYGFFCLSYNACGQAVTKAFNSSTRSILEACRAISVWIGSLLVYLLSSGRHGETLNPYSWLELLGFCFLAAGSLAFNSVFRLPGVFGKGMDARAAQRAAGTEDAIGKAKDVEAAATPATDVLE